MDSAEITPMLLTAVGSGGVAVIVTKWLEHRRSATKLDSDVQGTLLARLNDRIIAVERDAAEARRGERECLEMSRKTNYELGLLRAEKDSLRQAVAENNAMIAELQRRLRSLERSISGTVVCNAEGLIREWSAGAEAIFGWRENEIIGKNVEILVPGIARAAHHAAFAAAVARGSSPPKFRDAFALRQDGTDVPVSIVTEGKVIDGELVFEATVTTRHI